MQISSNEYLQVVLILFVVCWFGYVTSRPIKSKASKGNVMSRFEIIWMKIGRYSGMGVYVCMVAIIAPAALIVVGLVLRLIQDLIMVGYNAF